MCLADQTSLGWDELSSQSHPGVKALVIEACGQERCVQSGIPLYTPPAPTRGSRQSGFILGQLDTPDGGS